MRHARGSEAMGGPELQVAPMLDMAFQLLAFFILTYRPPSTESRLDLELPAAPIALPGPAAGATTPAPGVEELVEDVLTVRARADDRGELAELWLDDLSVPDLKDLRDRLQRYQAALAPRPLRVVFRADDPLKYGHAARILEVLTAVDPAAVRLDGPESSP